LIEAVLRSPPTHYVILELIPRTQGAEGFVAIEQTVDAAYSALTEPTIEVF
jgi:hypothetical protein